LAGLETGGEAGVELMACILDGGLRC